MSVDVVAGTATGNCHLSASPLLPCIPCHKKTSTSPPAKNQWGEWQFTCRVAVADEFQILQAGLEGLERGAVLRLESPALLHDLVDPCGAVLWLAEVLLGQDVVQDVPVPCIGPKLASVGLLSVREDLPKDDPKGPDISLL